MNSEPSGSRKHLTRINLSGFLTLLLLGFHSGQLQALQIHYESDRPESLIACDREIYQGAIESGNSCYQDLLNDDGLVAEQEFSAQLIKAMAASALGDFRQANRLFREASVNTPGAQVSTQWGKLYLRTHQAGEASALFREAIQFDFSYLPARTGLADALASQFAGRARDQVREILEEKPDSIPANLILARMLLESGRVDEGRDVLAEISTFAEQQNLPQLDVYALQASADLLDGIFESEWTTKALEENPSFGGIYAIPAHFYIITYRYREAVALYRKAVETEPGLATAHSKLGINLLRINNINGARHHLEQAYEIDPFDTDTVNTLRLLDDIDKMRVSYADVLPGDTQAAGDKAETPEGAEPIGRMLLRLDRDSVDALEPYVVELVSDAVRAFTRRYDFSLEKPVVVELYHNHDDFGVRTVSTPGVGLLGVTFGYVVAMDSPKARSPEDFHWGSTLWHEIAHVFTLEAANHLLPRWFSEGISVYEEWNTGPLPSRELPLQVLQMFDQGQFLPITDLDSGFVRPTYEGQVTVSYMQAGLICDYISERWGHEALVTMLKAFSLGLPTATALKTAIKMEPADFDREFNQHVRLRFGNILQNLDHWGQLGEIISSSLSRAQRFEDQGRGGMTEENLLAIREISQQRLDYYPEHVGPGSAWLSLAFVEERLGNTDAALEARWQWFKRGGSSPSVLQALASELDEAGRSEDSFAVLEALNWVLPYTVQEHRRLGDYYLAQGQPQKAIREFDALLGVRPQEASSVLLGKARAYQLQNKLSEARRSVLLSLEQSPFYRDAQELLLELSNGE